MSISEHAGFTVPDDLRDLPEARGVRSATPVVLRHVSPISVARFSVIFYLCLWAASMVAMVLVWAVASAFGVVGGLEGFLREVGFAGFELHAFDLLTAGALAGLVVGACATALTVAGSMLFNVLSDLIGGIHLTLADEPAPRAR